jgi:hypothetical protein
MFARYAAARLRWKDVDVVAETSFDRVLKDTDLERGKRICVEGELTAIRREDLGPRNIQVGSLRVSDAWTVAFAAVGTTGNLNRASKARFCGIVTGASGAGISMTGMFDLPENRSPIVEREPGGG